MRRIALLAVLLLSGGCASIIEGTTQQITINTVPPGARCDVLREGAVIAQVSETPAGTLVQRTKHDLTVRCMKEGCDPTDYFLKSGTSGGTFGNILLGGGIGWAIDSAAGADNEYPEYANITLSCPTTTSTKGK